mgnify:CR=1 FL=1
MKSFFNFDVEKLFRELETFNNKLIKDMESETENIEKAIRSGELKGKGKWNFKKIDEPGVKGYILYGYFGTDQPLELFEPLEPFDPFKPSRRPPMPERPFKIPSAAIEEIREPLTDIFEEEKAMRIYVELPGEEKEDIQLNVANGRVEVKAKKFYKMMDLPTKNIDVEKTTARYKNGVLEVSISKAEKPSEESAWKVEVK